MPKPQKTTAKNNPQMEIQTLKRALKQAQKLQSLGFLTTGIAHDFNNILYAMMGFAELASKKVPADNPAKNYLDKIQQAGQRGRKLIASLLAFSRKNPEAFESFPVAEVINNTLNLLEPTLPARIRLNVQRDPTEAAVLGDQTQLQQVLMNLVNNAVDAIAEQGIIEIATSILRKNQMPTLDFKEPIPERDYCCIRVKDNGHGIDAKTLRKIFDPFFTTKAPNKGTGLGLASAKEIVQQHGGYIQAQSQLTQGTEFLILLPCQLTK